MHQNNEYPMQFSQFVDILETWLDYRNDYDCIDSHQFAIDMKKSALLRRLISGKEPLLYAPPKNNKQPWYELIDNGHADHCNVEDCEDYILINGCMWEVNSKTKDEYIVRFNAITCRLWFYQPNKYDKATAYWRIEVIDEVQ